MKPGAGRWIALTSCWVVLGMPTIVLGGVFEFAVDVPAKLGAVDYLPNQVVRSNGGVYTLQQTFPSDLSISALHRKADGSWLFSPRSPVTLGATTYEPRDIVRFDGATYSLALSGAAAGIPAGVRIDALFLDSAGHFVISVDVPASLSGTDYGPSDLVLYNAGFSSYWDGDAKGVPVSSNLVGADQEPAGDMVLAFDVPTRLGAVDYLPGQLVRWNSGTAFSSYAVDPAWPTYARTEDFNLLPASGAVSDGGAGGLRLAKLGSSQLTLTWGASCASADTDYEIYTGTIGSYYSHVASLCTTGGALNATIATPGGNVYFLVVPRNSVAEGSYGRRSSGVERPVGVGACRPQALGTCH